MSTPVIGRLCWAILVTQMAVVVVGFLLLAIWSLVIAATESVVGGLVLFTIIASAFPLIFFPARYRIRQVRGSTRSGQAAAG